MKSSKGQSLIKKWLPNNLKGANMILTQGAACIQSFESVPQGCQVLSPFVQTCIFILLKSSKGFAAIHIDSPGCIALTLKKIIAELRNMGDSQITAKIVGGDKYYTPVLLFNSSSASIYNPAYQVLKQEGVKYEHDDYCLIAGRLLIQLVITSCLAVLAKDLSHWKTMLLLTLGAVFFAIYERFFNATNYMCKITYSPENGLEFNTENMKDMANNVEFEKAFEAKMQELIPNGKELLLGRILLNSLSENAFNDFMINEPLQTTYDKHFKYLRLSEHDIKCLIEIRKLLVSKKGKGIEFLRFYLPNKQPANQEKIATNSISIVEIN